MKNASHNQINTAISSPNAICLLDQQPQIHDSKLITNRTSDEQNIIPQQSSTSSKKIPSGGQTVPHAKALYDFVSKENGFVEHLYVFVGTFL